MFGKSIICAVAMFAITTPSLAQEQKPASVNKANTNSVLPASSDKKLNTLNTQGLVKQKPINPDKPDFVGAPAVIVESSPR